MTFPDLRKIMWKFLYKWNNNKTTNKMDKLCENFYISEITIRQLIQDCKIWMFGMWYFPDLKKIIKDVKISI